MATVELPSWLAAEQRYEPTGARHRVMQKNVLHLASLLERVRLGGGAHEGGSMIDRALSSVSAPVRLVGMFVCVLCVCLTQSPLYLMLMAAVALVLVAVRPARGLRATFVPALGAAGLAVVLALPALLLGASATSAMLKIALKTFINVSLVLGVSWTLTWSRMSAALKMLHLPDEVIFTFDMALKHIEVLGRTAHDLCESVMLRSVGRAPEGFSRTDSIAGIMGMTFIKAMECSRAMDEAMLCRGFAGAYPAPARVGFGWRDAVYAAGVALLAVCVPCCRRCWFRLGMQIGKGDVLTIDMNSAAGTNGAGGAEATPLIELRDVVFSYAGHTVVDGVSLQVDRGELVALLGPNGCGKTTIMRLINGLELADAGAYLFDGHAIDAAFLKDSAAAQRFHQRVGFVFQNADAQLFCATVGEEVAFGPAQMGLPADELERRVRDAMGLFQVADLADASPYQLSGGQKKRVALAAVVSMNPDILVLDEPTNGLDEDSCDIVVNFLLAYIEAGKTVLMSTHHQDLVRRLGARAIYIDRYHHVVEAPSPSYGTESGATD